MRLLAALMTLAVCCPVPAAAEDVEFLFKDNVDSGKYPAGPEAEKYVHDLAVCALGKEGGAEALAQYPASRKADELLYWPLYGASNCGNGRMKFNARALRGPVAEQLLKRDFDLATWAAKGKPVELYKRPSNDRLEKLTSDSKSAVVMTEIGECVAGGDPGDTATLVQSEPGSKDEMNAISAITPVLSGCIPPAVEMKIGKAQLRAYIAEGAYRYAVAKMGTAG